MTGVQTCALPISGVKVQGPAFDSNIAVTTNVLQFFAANSTIRTTDIAAFNFTRVNMPLSANVRITGSNNNDGYWVVFYVDDNLIRVSNTQNLSLNNEDLVLQ